MVSKAERERRETNSKFSALMDQLETHLRVGAEHKDRTSVTLLGHARDLHGPAGVCTCCPRRADG